MLVTGKEAGAAATACALVVGAGMAATSLAGLVHERDQLRHQVQALRHHPAESAPASPVVPPAAGAPSGTPSPPVVRAVQVVPVLAKQAALPTVIPVPPPTRAEPAPQPPTSTPPPPEPSPSPRPSPLLSTRVTVNLLPKLIRETR